MIKNEMSTKPANQKRRNNEKRKEKSREAARCRRSRETEAFNNLTAALPAKKEEVEQLDKASIMRLAISYLRVRDVVSKLLVTDEPCLRSPKGMEEVFSENSYMKALDGFVLLLSQQGDMVYCSENISEHLGISQMEMMGQSVFEFTHPCDHEEIRDALRSSETFRRDLLLRFKCTLTSKGRNVHLKSASYKVIRVTGHMLIPKTSDSDNENKTKADEKLSKVGSIVAVGRPIPHPSNIETPFDGKTFLTKHSLDMKITYTDDALMKTLGFKPDELSGRSLYDYHHAADSASLVHQFKSLFSKGQCETGQYRFLAKTGGYAWVQTQATVITDKQQKPVSVVCVNYVISGIECKDEVFAVHQAQHADLKPKVLHEPSEICEAYKYGNGEIVAPIPPDKEKPVAVTSSIFAPRTGEMVEEEPMFTPDEEQTMLKDDPEDLSQYAPASGDGCISLDSNSFEFFDELNLLNDNYCPLWADELDNGSPVDSLPNDSILLSSPEPHETDSSCEKSSLLTDLSLDPFDNNKSDIENDAKSPFIPTIEDTPLTEPAVMWGALPENVSQAKPQPSGAQSPPSAPALQRLLTAPPTGPRPQDLISNIYSDQGLIPSRSISTWETGVKRTLTRQDETPAAKRCRRSPSPPRTGAPSSSVLMNLLEHQARNRAGRASLWETNQQKIYQTVPLNNCNLPLPVINIVENMSKTIKSNTFEDNSFNMANLMTPLTLNVDSPMYSVPASPNTTDYTTDYSPAMSPARMDYVASNYSTPQSLSPAGKYQTYSPNQMSPNSDPYLNKMQLSPNYELQPNYLLDHDMPPTEFCIDLEISVPNDLLSEIDELRV